MSRNTVYRLHVLIFTMAICLILPACRIFTEKACDADAASAASDPGQETISKLKEVIIPEMTFYSPTTMVDAVDFFTKAIRDYDESGISSKKHSVYFRLRLPADPKQERREPSDVFDTVIAGIAPRIAAISVRNISLYDALHLVCEATEMSWRVERQAIVVEPNIFTDTELITRTYTVPPSLDEYLPKTPSDPTTNEKSNKPWIALFDQLSKETADFTEFTYLSAINKLRVTGTPKNLKLLETVLDQFAPCMVEVEMQIHAFHIADIELLRLSGGMSLEKLMALRQKGKAKQVATATALTKSGQETIVRAVKEVIYPSELLTDVSPTDSNVTIRSAANALIPSYTMMRETGMILQIVPEIRENNIHVFLTLKLQWITLDRWESYPADLTTGWLHTTRSFKQPVFEVTSLESQALAKDGETLLVGSCSTPDGEWVNVGFLTTRLRPVQPKYASLRTEQAQPLDEHKCVETKKKLKKIIIPEVKFVPPATISDALRFLKEASIQYDNPELPEAQRGVNFFLKLPLHSWGPTGTTTNADPFTSTTSNGVPLIPALQVRFLDLNDNLKLLCDVTGMKFNIRDNIVWIVPCQGGEALITRTYCPWMPSYEGVSKEARLQGSSQLKKTCKSFFEQLGVPWPAGSSIDYEQDRGWLRVTNTHENLDLFEQVCRDLSLFPRMVEMDVQIHAFSSEDIEQVRLSGDVSVEALMALRKAGKSKPVASATAMTRLGSEADIKTVQEVIYPTEMLSEANQTEGPVTLESGPQALVPGNFTTQETGMTLQVVTEADTTDGSYVNVTLKTTWTTLEGWKSYPADIEKGLISKRLPFRQPVIRKTYFETQTLVQEDRTILLGCSSTLDGKWVHVGFLTVKECR